MAKITPKMKEIIEERASILGAIGIPGSIIPHSDIPIIAATWANMFHELAKESNLNIDNKVAIKLALALVKSGCLFYGGIKFMSSVFTWAGFGTAGITTVFGAAANSAANYYFTKHMGYRVAGIFTRDGVYGTDVAMTVASVLGVTEAFDAITPNEITETLNAETSIVSDSNIEPTEPNIDLTEAGSNVRSNNSGPDNIIYLSDNSNRFKNGPNFI